MFLELDEEELVEAPRVAPFFSCGGYTLDNLLTLEENTDVDGYGATEILGISGSKHCWKFLPVLEWKADIVCVPVLRVLP